MLIAAFAFDYDGSGKLDHIVLYRPGYGTVWILKNSGGTFTTVYAQEGIGGFDLLSSADRAFAFDYDGSGKLDHIALYRPGTSTIYIVMRSADTFTTVYVGAPSPPTPLTDDQHLALYNSCMSSQKFNLLGFAGLVTDLVGADIVGISEDLIQTFADGYNNEGCRAFLTDAQKMQQDVNQWQYDQSRGFNGPDQSGKH